MPGILFSLLLTIFFYTIGKRLVGYLQVKSIPERLQREKVLSTSVIQLTALK